MNKDVPQMNRILQACIASACAVALGACGGYGNLPGQSSSSVSGNGAGAAGGASGTGRQSVPTGMTFAQFLAGGYIVPICASTGAMGYAHCDGFRLTDAGKQIVGPVLASRQRSKLSSGPPPGIGWGPPDYQSAYGLTAASATMGTGQTVGVVVYGHAPSLASDLAVYRSAYGLSPCTTASGCLRQVDQLGGINFPATQGWGQESGVDADMISAVCPKCNILVVEVNTPTIADLSIGENTAAGLGANAINNSWGTTETGMGSYASAFNHPGIPIVAAAGTGAVAGAGFSSVQEVPAAFSTVIAVGGTDIKQAATPRGWTDSLWLPIISGCSTLVAKPAWQKDAGCSMRTVSDISFATGSIATYSTAFNGGWSPNGWWTLYGDSSASPAIAALAAMSGTRANDASFLYTPTGLANLNDVTINGGAGYGSQDGIQNLDGTCVAPGNYSTGVVPFSYLRKSLSGSGVPAYLCSAVAGYDAPTGNGTPKGVGAFTAASCPGSGGTPNPHPTENSKGAGACGTS